MRFLYSVYSVVPNDMIMSKSRWYAVRATLGSWRTRSRYSRNVPSQCCSRYDRMSCSWAIIPRIGLLAALLVSFDIVSPRSGTEVTPSLPIERLSANRCVCPRPVAPCLRCLSHGVHPTENGWMAAGPDHPNDLKKQRSGLQDEVE